MPKASLVISLSAFFFAASANAGMIFVGNYGSGSIESYTPTGTDLGTFVTSGSGGLSGPGGFSFGPDGNLYVASRGTGSILEYNGSTGAFIQTFSSPTGEGTPDDIQFGSNGNAYVASSAGFYILNGTTGAVLSAVADGGSGAYGGTFLPSNGDFLLSDIGGNIFEYTLGGVLVGTYASGLNQNVGITVGADGRIYAADQGDGTIGVAPLGGGAASTFASGFTAPEYLALYGVSLYLTDYSVSTVDILNSSGTVTGSFSTSFNPYGIAVQGSAVPEPTTMSLLALGMGCCILLGRRVQRARR